MNKLKYDKDLYIDSENGMYSQDEDAKMYTMKIVKCRKEHQCGTCSNKIEVGDFSLYEQAVFDGEFESVYTCIDCVEKWMEESGQVDIEEEEKI